MSKLTREQVEDIPAQLKDLTQKELADKYGVTTRTISGWVRKLRAKGYEVITRKGVKPLL